MRQTGKLLLIETWFLISLIAFSGPVMAQRGTTQDLREELGVTRMAPIYPEADAVIDKTRPPIAVDLSNLDREPDLNTVEILLDGKSILSLCEVTRQYILCDLDADLAMGGHDVFVTALDKTGKPLNPLGFRFSIGVQAPAAVSELKADRTTGRFIASLEFVNAVFTPNPLVDVAGQFERPEGTNFDADFEFDNTSEGRTLSGALSREVQSYGGLEVDKGRLSYFASETEGYEIDAGDFWDSWTPLSLRGTQVRGLEYRDNTHWGSWSVMAGRTQDPSTSGSFKEYGGGASAKWNTSDSNVLRITALTLNEQEDLALSVLRNPRRRSLVSIEDQWMASDKLSVRGELSGLRIREKGSSTEDAGAWELEAEYKERLWNLGVRGFRYGSDFYPVAEGSSQNIVNDKRGWGATLGLRPSLKWSLGGDYENYDSLVGGERTFEKEAEYLAFRPGGYWPSLTLRHSGLSVSGALQNESKTNMALLNWPLPSTKFTGDSRLYLMWQGIEFSGQVTGGSIETRSRQRFYAFNTNIIGKLNLSWDRSDGNTVDRVAGNRSKTRSEHVAVSWTVIPFKLLVNGDWGLDRGTGTTTDTRLKDRGLGFKVFATPVWDFKLDFSWIDYTDRINSFYEYDQFIVKIEGERKF